MLSYCFGMDDAELSAWETDILEAVLSAETIRELVAGTVRVMDSWLQPIVSKEMAKRAFAWKDNGGPEDRFHCFMGFNAVPDDRDSGNGLYFRVLYRAYNLHTRMTDLTDTELQEAARDVCLRIRAYSPRLAPPWLGVERDSAVVPEDAIARIASNEDVLRDLRAWFRDALAYAQGYCESMCEVADDGP